MGVDETSSATEEVLHVVARYVSEIFEVGGEILSRDIPSQLPTGVEAEWLKLLEQEFAST
jgi:hypothetical protein